MRTSPFPYGFTISQGYKPQTNPSHTGYDIRAKTSSGSFYSGAPVYPFTSGTVWLTYHYPGNYDPGHFDDRWGGNFVIVNENGRKWYFGHLRDILVKQGQYVDENTIIGHQGATGFVTGEHLHTELRVGNTFSSGTPIDLLQYVQSNTMNYLKIPYDYAKTHTAAVGKDVVIHLNDPALFDNHWEWINHSYKLDYDGQTKTLQDTINLLTRKIAKARNALK